MDGDDIEVDDLFGDPSVLVDSSLNVPIAGSGLEPLHNIQVPVRGLAQRVDELHLSGCCQRIAWSRQGGVAYISSDGLDVRFRCLRFHSVTGKWDLCKEFSILKHDVTDEQHPFVHVEWSQTGGDLAVADAKGRISVFNMSMTAINHASMARSATMDPDDELSRPVGMYWLNPERQNMMVLQSSKDNDRWTHILTRRKPLGPYWPRAVAVINRAGAFRLIYQKPDTTWSSAKADLKSLSSTGNLLSHAAIAPTQENKLLVATQTLDRKLFVYLIQIAWPEIKRDPTTEVVPTLHIELVKGFIPSEGIDSNHSNGALGDSAVYKSQGMGVSHLSIIPTSDVDKAVHLPPMILAVYTSSVNSLGLSSEGRPGSSMICRWNIASVERKLHPRFDEIPSKTGSTSLSPKTDLQRLPDFPFEQVIVSVHQVDSGNAITISIQDGSTAVYNPVTMTELYLETDINEVTSMSQSGFTFPINPSPFQIAFSPTGCASVSLNTEGKLDLTSMEYHSGLEMNSSTHNADPGLDTALASISLAFVRACYSTSNSDDILLCILRSLRPDQLPQLLTSMYQSLFRDADLTAGPGPGSDIDKLPRNQMVAKILGLQAALGYTTHPSAEHPAAIANGETKHPSPLHQQPHRNLSASFAWMTLNIRYLAVHVYVTLSTAKSPSTEYAEPDILDVICNNIRWSLDLFKLIVDDLFEMSETAETNGTTTTETETGDVNGDSTTALTTLLITSLWSRFFLRTISRCFRGILAIPKSPSQHTLDAASVLAFSRMAETIESAGLPLEAFERLLGGADKFVQMAYSEAGYGDRERADTERSLLARGKVGETVLRGVVGRLCEEVLPTTRGEVDRLGLFVGEYGWVRLEGGVMGMGMGGGENGGGGVGAEEGFLVRERQKGPVDVHRKKVVKGSLNREVRRCVRCGCVTVDVPAPPRNWPKFSQQQGMRCVCESGFVVEKLGDL